MASFSNDGDKENKSGISIGAEKQSSREHKLLVDNLSWTSLNKMTFDENTGKKIIRTTLDYNNLHTESNPGTDSATGSRVFTSRLSKLGKARRVPRSEVCVIDDDDDSDEDEFKLNRHMTKKQDEIKCENEIISNKNPIIASQYTSVKDDELKIEQKVDNKEKMSGHLPIQSSFTPFRDPNYVRFDCPNLNVKLTQPQQRHVQFMVPITPSSFSASYIQQPEFPLSDVITVKSKSYYVLSLLGKGGSSQVFLVFEPQKKCLLAIKCINLDISDESINNAYKNEICLLQKLQYSDRVIKLYDFEFNSEKNSLYVVMEKGDTDLSSVIRTYSRDGQITGEMIKFYWSEMLKTVSVIHKAGIIHSDLKPANFLLVGGRMKLIDFGISSSIQTDMTSVFKDVQVGTFNYMSPEAIQETTQAQDNEGRKQPLFKINVKSDVWSLGCILYNLVYGKTPFQDIRQPVAKMQAIVNPNHEINFPNIQNKQLIDVMKKCLIRDPKQRSSIEELLQHAYLQESANASSSPQPTSLSRIMKQLAALTPNSIFKAERELNQMADKFHIKKN